MAILIPPVFSTSLVEPPVFSTPLMVPAVFSTPLVVPPVFSVGFSIFMFMLKNTSTGRGLIWPL